MIAPHTIATVDAYSAFLESLQPILITHAYRFIDRIWSTHLEADDLVQESFLMLWSKREQIAAAAEPVSYAVSIAKNAMRQYITREINPAAVVSLDEPLTGPSGDTYTPEIDARIVATTSARNLAARRRVLALVRRHLTHRQSHALLLDYGIETSAGRPQSAWVGTPNQRWSAKHRGLKNLREALNCK